MEARRRGTRASGISLADQDRDPALSSTATLHVKVVPRASTDQIVGWLDSVLKVRVAAAPEAGRANAALEALLAGVLGVRKSAVRVASGHAATRKRVEIAGVAQADLERRLRAAGF
jgi:uncharacterized protein YggU (UPF0235/DUF167 family)